MHVVGEADPGVDEEGRAAAYLQIASCNASICVTNRSDQRSSRFTVKKAFPREADCGDNPAWK